MTDLHLLVISAAILDSVIDPPQHLSLVKSSKHVVTCDVNQVSLRPLACSLTCILNLRILKHDMAL